MLAPQKDIFLIGLDPFNRQELEDLRHADRYHFHELLSYDEIKGGGRFTFTGALEKAEERLRNFGGAPDGIVTFWDFPATSLLAVLTDTHRLPGPTLESTLKCEHKYWSRLEQERAAPEACPAFEALDPFAEDAADGVKIDFPFWIKPVKGTGSYLAYKVSDRAELDKALEQIRGNIERIARPFNHILERADLPEEVRRVDGRHCIVEASMKGSLHTVTGYVHRGEITLYGLVDSLNYPNTSSFLNYEYPSSLPRPIEERMGEISRRVIARLGLDDSPFNIEFFHDPEEDRFGLLEVNPRVSQSHAEIFRQVDGDSDEAIAVQLALGEDPDWSRGEGPAAFGAKFYVRRFRDGFVRAVPSAENLAAVKREFPGVVIEIEAEAGKRLSEDATEDSYSYDLAHLHFGADSREGLHEQFEALRERLEFDIEEVEGNGA